MSDVMIEPEMLLHGFEGVIFDCRFSLADPAEGRRLHGAGHVPGAYYLDLECDLSGPTGEYGGRHPLPRPEIFAATLAQCGVGPETDVVAYDDSRFAFASRLWWMMRALGFRPPRLLNGGYAGFLQAGGVPGTEQPRPVPRPPEAVGEFGGCCDIDGVRAAQEQGVLLVDSREAPRYRGEEEPIDPVAGHIPGAINRPWQGVTDAGGRVLGEAQLQAHWGDALEARDILVYCGSGVTACVNLFSLAILGRGDARLYAGSWSDWCNYLHE